MFFRQVSIRNIQFYFHSIHSVSMSTLCSVKQLINTHLVTPFYRTNPFILVCSLRCYWIITVLRSIFLLLLYVTQFMIRLVIGLTIFTLQFFITHPLSLYIVYTYHTLLTIFCAADCTLALFIHSLLLFKMCYNSFISLTLFFHFWFKISNSSLNLSF